MTVAQQAVQFIALSWALYYARYHMAVFPVHSVHAGGQCSCGNPGCERQGKHPRTAQGFKDAALDEGLIQNWFTSSPDANVGVRTGIESNLIVLDVDVKSGGPASLEALLAEHGPLPVTPTVRTGSGGTHYYFAHPREGLTVGNRQKMRPGLDLRGDGGYVVAASSSHVSGGRYAFEPGRGLHDVPLAPMPLWLKDLALGHLDEAAPPSAGSPSSEDALGKGQRHPTLFAMAGAMRQKGTSRAGIEAALRAENQARCSPPLEEKDIQKMVADILKYPAGGVPSVKLLSALPREEVVRETKEAFESASDPKVELEQVQWVARGLVAERSITLITGKPKVAGKSTFVAHLVAKVLDGHHFIGMVTVKTPVVVLTEERTTFVELLKRTGLMGRADIKFLRYSPARQATFPEQVMAAREVCKEMGAKLLIIDTLAQFIGLRGDTENDPGAALEGLKPVQEAANEGLAVIVVHHEKKSGGGVGDSSRGSTAFTGAVDIIMSVQRPEGQTSPKVRVISTLSRYPCTPDTLYVELTEAGFERREEAAVISSDIEKKLLERAPTEEANAIQMTQFLSGTQFMETTARKVANKLVKSGQLRRKGEGKRGDPHLYWREGTDSFHPTPSPTGAESIPAPGVI